MLEGLITLTKERYRVYSSYLKEKYGEKVYKLPINLPLTCPNREDSEGVRGCIFCGEDGAGHENLSNTLSITDQLEQNRSYIQKKYKANKYIAYFQSFTNTYMPLKQFERYMEEAAEVEGVVEIAISTRPDSIHEAYLEVLKKIEREKNIQISIELGLQTVNYHTLDKIHRGHGLAEFIDAVLKIKSYGFPICTHLILNCPWDDQRDVIENARILSVLKVEQVKLHALYVVKDTELARQVTEEGLILHSMDEYIERVILFLEHLSPNIVLQRLIGRAPSEDTLVANWNTSWWKIKGRTDELLEERQTFQGKKYQDLSSRGLRKEFFN